MAAPLRAVSRLVQGAFHANFSRSITSRFLLHTTAVQQDLDSDFTSARDRVGTLTEDPGNEAKLKLYALFKQASQGKVAGSRPGMMDFVGRAKWDAWNALGDISQDDAKQQYIVTVNELAGSEPAKTEPSAAASSNTSTGDVTLTRDGKISIVSLNRPEKKNAIKIEMYDTIADMFEQIAKDDSSIAVITGTGDFYCSGNDLSNFMQINPAEIAAFAEKGGRILQRFVGSFIDFPKPLIGVVNGPAVGVSVTTLGLCDAVFATDRATFHTPFSALGQTPEGCSSYVFPKLMGSSKATEMLLFNRKLTAAEACERGLVAEVFPNDSFQTEVWNRVRQIADFPPQTMRLSKGLIRESERELLHKVNARECKQLVERWQSEECINAIMAFFSRKSKM